MEGGILEILGKIGFDWQIALVNLFNFLIIFFLLKKFAFGPIGKVIKERQEKITKGLDDAKEAEAALSNAKSTKEQIIREANESATKIAVRSQEDGKNIIKEAKDKATKEKEEILRQAKLDADKEKKNSEEAFRKETSVIVAAGVRKVMEGYVSAGKGDDLINEMLRKA